MENFLKKRRLDISQDEEKAMENIRKKRNLKNLWKVDIGFKNLPIELKLEILRHLYQDDLISASYLSEEFKILAFDLTFWEDTTLRCRRRDTHDDCMKKGLRVITNVSKFRSLTLDGGQHLHTVLHLWSKKITNKIDQLIIATHMSGSYCIRFERLLCYCKTDDSFVVDLLKNLNELRSLTIHVPVALSGRVFIEISNLKNLEELNISSKSCQGGTVTSKILQLMGKNLTKLRALNIGNGISINSKNKTVLFFFEQLKSLRTLSLYDARFLKENSCLAALVNLQSLSICAESISNADLSNLSKLTQLKSLGLSYVNRPQLLSTFFKSPFHDLVELTLSSPTITDDDDIDVFSLLSSCPRLRKLNLRETWITREGCQSILDKAAKIRSLDLQVSYSYFDPKSEVIIHDVIRILNQCKS